ncbi:CHAP domain-containing protein [Saccharothrix deserti]|uniref:CHAP domain-containing protein n=1 Tax=Saccharothrix deserti TaxID=2593674 RepID=UPI00131B75A1|nr:CHAP domain-containing protein [Saccharothrix deserti]
MQSTLLKNTVTRILVATAAVVGVALLGMSTENGPMSAAPELVAAKKTTTPADDETRRKIVEAAENEMKSDRNRETGENCNSYSPGGKCQAWCADFAKYVWNKGGAKTDSVNSAAKSFRDYGQKNKTWKSGAGVKNVKPGDAVTYRLNDKNFDNDHVGIVTKVNKKTGKITVISGNSGDKIRKITIDPKKSQVTGYSSPVEKKNAKPKKSAEPDKKNPGKKSAEKKTQEPKSKKKTQDTKPGQVEPEGPVILSEAQVSVSPGVIG